MAYSDNYDPNEGVAIIGMVGRFPGASNIDSLWQLLINGEESISHFSSGELEPVAQDELNLRRDPNYVLARGILDDIDMFDAGFFGISPNEAAVTDPQQRCFLESSWEALESSGYDPTTYEGSIGIYAGMSNNTYFLNNVHAYRDMIQKVGNLQTMMGNEKDYLATRISYKLNLRGPGLNIYTACSTSLVAVCQAFTGLTNYQCDMALAGGVSITLPQKRGYLYHEGAITSPDGHCRPFDIESQGTVFSNGLGIVVLKRLEDALEDGDTVYAVIKGAALNNDGSSKVSFTAPSVDGQAEAISMAQAIAGIDPETISYIEAHGTATPLGDPIEIAGLTQAFKKETDAQGFCALGSVKSNIGHLDVAAGVAGLIKTVLAMKFKQLPPSLHFTSSNPDLGIENSPFFVNSELTDWISETGLLRAGVSSFGVGGTNAHVVLEEAPAVPHRETGRKQQLLVLSARSKQALDSMSNRLSNHLERHPELDLADVCFTLQDGRQAMPHRRIAVASDIKEVTNVLQSAEARGTVALCPDTPPRIVFVFPGQGTQYPNMGRNFYNDDPEFRKLVDHCAVRLEPKIGRDLREILYPRTDQLEKSQKLLKKTIFTQPAIFVIEYALARLWERWGIVPDTMFGHSIGEFVAATLAGVFQLDDALHLVAARAKLMQEQPPGSMLSVRRPANELDPYLSTGIDIAAINAPKLCVVSGPDDAIDDLLETLNKEQIPASKLHTSHAFHSAMMDDIVEPFADEVRKVSPVIPERSFISTVTAQSITDEEATDPMYWARHLRNTVRFADTVREAWQVPTRLLLEVGPRATSTQLAKQTAGDPKTTLAVSSLEASADNGQEWRSMLLAAGKLWLQGISLNWCELQGTGEPRRIPLPTYPFERKRYWLDPIFPELVSSGHAPSQTIRENEYNMGEFELNKPELSFRDDNMDYVANHGEMAKIRREQTVVIINQIIEDITGIEMGPDDADASFLELGLDSLTLTQCALMLKRETGLEVSLRQLIETESSIASLAKFVDPLLSDDLLPELKSNINNQAKAFSELHSAASVINPSSQSHPKIQQTNDYTPKTIIEQVVAQQLKLMAKQLKLLGEKESDLQNSIVEASGSMPITSKPVKKALEPHSLIRKDPQLSSNISNDSVVANKILSKKIFGAAASIERTGETLSSDQQNWLEAFITRYNSQTAGSKNFTAQNRHCLADPRAVAGFKPKWKELIYPIVVDRSAGSRVWDIDGNEYIDMTNGFGSNLFGHSPTFTQEAIGAQLKKGIEIGPQHPLAGEVAQLICEMTSFDRAIFCNTGSEAVMGAMRICRTVTGRDKIVMFNNDYHGMFDEVIVRGAKNLRSIPAAPGIPVSSVENMMVLEYGNPHSLRIIAEKADEIAAVLVEPVQTRNLELQPKAFLHELRALTENYQIALIFDEIVTGFRSHIGGAQAYFDISADIATYGKVVGGGMPIGVIVGKSKYMDTLDGGLWHYGDTSVPEVGVTYFAGTFVRHPLALAAAKAALSHLKKSGPELQETLNEKTLRCVTILREFLRSVGAPLEIRHFSSAFQLEYTTDSPYGGLIYPLLRSKGIHIFEGRTWFFTTSHTDEDITAVCKAIQEAISDMIEGGFINTISPSPTPEFEDNQREQSMLPSNPPVTGAKLGKCPDGNPAWFIPDPNRKGKFLRIN